MSYQHYRTTNFGPSYAGALANAGAFLSSGGWVATAEILDPDGNATGVAGATFTVPDGYRGPLLWCPDRTASGADRVYNADEINPGPENLDAKVSTRSTYAGGPVASVTDKTGFKLAQDGLDAVTVETGLNARQALSMAAAAASGVVGGASGNTITIKGAGVVTTRITATVDRYGNRSAVTLSPPV